MSTIKSSAEHLTLNADGASKDIKFQANGVEKASIDSSGNLTVSGNLTSVGIDDNATSTAITIDASENVGIGTSSPDNKLTIGDSSTIVVGKQWGLDFQDTTKGEPQAFIYAEGRYAGNFNTDLIFGTIGTSGSSAERMRIDSSGNVLMNTTAVHGNNSKVSVKTDVDKSGVGITAYKSSNSNYYFMNFIANTTSVGDIYSNGSSTTYATSSDYRLKENVDYTWDATTRLKQLKPARFNFIADDTTTVDGFLAHEVQSVVPEAILGTHNGMKDEEYEVTPAVEEVRDEEGNITTEAVEAVMGTRSVPDYQGIDQSKLVPLLVKTIQELEARITALEA